METITLTDQQKENLCTLLAKLVFEFRKDESVECIYYAAYNIENDNSLIEPVIDFRIVYTIPTESPDLHEKLTEYSSLYQGEEDLERYGLKIKVTGNSSIFYHCIHTIEEGSLSHKYANALYNSIILYDQYGKFTNINDITKQAKARYIIPWIYSIKNRIQLVPPIDEPLKRALDTEEMHAETEALREFIKSDLFRKLKELK